ncbi:hypothetical protein [Sphingobacterium daejeonense]|uniref:hypothetical protein n=1 Tax=Sphingobacterium daejeonense TaxID=371142 RepID=UPI0010C341F1|nr:hypothetical protein [Sphingobacterium daejeonense]VTP91613.1 Uncharacterised protein [Sphingobacterium daejeonense]
MSNNSVNWLYVLEDDLHPNVLTANVKQFSESSDYSINLKNHTQTFRPILSILSVAPATKPK